MRPDVTLATLTRYRPGADRISGDREVDRRADPGRPVESDLPGLSTGRSRPAPAGRSGRSSTRCGEPAFRDWEERTLAELTAGNPEIVLATGGGAVLREANRRRLREFGLVVWLTAHPSELARRLEADPRGLAERPALTLAGTLDEIVQVLDARTPLYAGTGRCSHRDRRRRARTRWPTPSSDCWKP